LLKFDDHLAEGVGMTTNEKHLRAARRAQDRQQIIKRIIDLEDELRKLPSFPTVPRTLAEVLDSRD
jgi:hypothetical protein